MFLMAVKRVTPQDIVNINELYLIHKVKAEVARQTGFSASTVAKYIIPDYKAEPINTEYEKIEEKTVDVSIFLIPNWNDLIIISDEERADMESMRGEANF